jgi:hypothetical protein
MFSLSNRVTFDHVERRTEKDASLDYSPLPRVSGRSFAMGLLVSMGGLIFGYVFTPRLYCYLLTSPNGVAVTEYDL